MRPRLLFFFFLGGGGKGPVLGLPRSVPFIAVWFLIVGLPRGHGYIHTSYLGIEKDEQEWLHFDWGEDVNIVKKKKKCNKGQIKKYPDPFFSGGGKEQESNVHVRFCLT